MHNYTQTFYMYAHNVVGIYKLVVFGHANNYYMGSNVHNPTQMYMV